MNISEIFKANGIADETVSAILEAMKANNIFLSSEENIDVRYGKLKTQHVYPIGCVVDERIMAGAQYGAPL